MATRVNLNVEADARFARPLEWHHGCVHGSGRRKIVRSIGKAFNLLATVEGLQGVEPGEAGGRRPLRLLEVGLGRLRRRASRA